QIRQYVDEYVKELPAVDLIQQRPSWTAEEYMGKLVNIPNLMDLVSNPFLLTLALDALPAVVASKKDLSTIRITRVQLYDSFVKRWLEVNRIRLEASPLNRDERAELDMLIEDSFLYHGIHYQKNLSTAIFIDHAGNPVVKYTHLRDKNTWKATFFSPSGQAKLLRESSTVKRSGAFFRFLHRSLLEYFYSRTIYDPLDYDEDDDDGLVEREPGPDLMTCLARMNIIKEPSILQFLAERVPQDLCFRQQLLDAIEKSKVDAAVALAAANAISILVKAGVSFNGADFRGIRIPSADVSDGQFDSAQFQGADLTGVDFSRTWLRNSDFSGAQLDDARFGELPFIEVDCSVTVCVYSPDGSMLAAGLESGNIEIYNTTTWEMIHCIKDVYLVRAIAFSPDGQKLVSSGHGRTVRLRDIASGKDVLAMKGHSSIVKSVAFSPCGKQIASSSHELRLWDSQTGECLFILVGHTWVVTSVMYSPEGGQFVSGSEDGTIRFWDPATGEAGDILSPSLGKVHRLAYSHDGQWIASGHKDGGLQLWNAVTKEAGPILQGHTESVTGIAFSPASQWLVSSSEDGTLKLWDVSTGALLSSLVGHQNFVNDVTVSPKGLQMATGGADKKIRLWETSSSRSSSGAELPGQSGDRGPVWRAAYSSDGRSDVTISDHTFRQWDASTGTPGSFSFNFPAPLWMESVEFSPDRGQIASCGESEGSIQLWDSRTGAVGHYLEGHASRVVELSYSPCGRWMASASWDNIVRIWDLHDPQQQCRVIPGTGDEIYEAVGDLVFTRSEPPRLVIGSSNGVVRLFDPRSGEMVMSKKLTTARVQQLASSPDGQQLALGINFSIHLWDMQSEKPMTTGQHAYGIDSRRRRKKSGHVSLVRGFFGTVQNIAWNPVIPMEFLTGCLDGSVRVWRVILNDGGDEDTVAVKLVWGSNLRILCAEGLAFKDAVGLDPIHSKLLGQRGVVEGVVPAGGGDGWGEGEAATGGGNGWSFSGGVVTAGDVWGDSGAVVTGGDTWGDVGGVGNCGDTWGDGGEMSIAGDAWEEDTAVVSDGNEWGEESALDVEGDEWGVDETAVTGGDEW
ncbi:Target of rapamycin complex subunit lst8, partial [Linnemannia elongata]